MNLAINANNPRQVTVRNAVSIISAREGILPENDGSMSYQMLHVYITNEGNRILDGNITTGTLAEYLSTLCAIHVDNGIDWKDIRYDFRIIRQVKLINRNPANPPHITKQDYSISHKQMIRFCSSLDTQNHNHVVAGAIATSLFWGLGRVPELIHSHIHSRLSLPSIIPHITEDGGRLFKIFLERPKVWKPYSQYITPVLSNDNSAAAYWLTLLNILSPNNYTSPWQLNNVTHADSAWLYRLFSAAVPESTGLLGPCSFRAGGFSHMLSIGYDFRLLASLGRWDSDAVERYLRNHPDVIVKAFASRNNINHGDLAPFLFL
jgi:hypothetical protein